MQACRTSSLQIIDKLQDLVPACSVVSYLLIYFLAAVLSSSNAMIKMMQCIIIVYQFFHKKM